MAARKLTPVLAAYTNGELASMTPHGSIGLARVLIDREAREVPAAHGDELRERDTSSSSACKVTKLRIENAGGAIERSPYIFSFGPRL